LLDEDLDNQENGLLIFRVGGGGGGGGAGCDQVADDGGSVVPAPLAIASFEGDHGMVGRALVRLFNERVLLGAFSWALAASSGERVRSRYREIICSKH
jgi:hypothetical protein